MCRGGTAVKAPKFSYLRAGSVEHVLELLARYGEDAAILAGGQSLLPALNLRLSQPKLLIDINRLDRLGGVELGNDHIRIGALTRHAEIAASPLILQHLPLLAEAMPHVAHPAVRNRGTFGGSIALADPAAELPACALALQARLVLLSAAGRREIAAAEFFTGLYRTARRPDELLVEAQIPLKGKAKTVSVFMELARRHGDFALAGLATELLLADGRIAEARLAYFGSDERPVLAGAVSAAITGKALDPTLAEAAVAALAGDLSPIDNAQASASMRLHLQRVLTRRALALALTRSRQLGRAA